jgi:hypothetical protein
MKKLCILFLALPIMAVAQGEKRFGIHAGATYSSLRGNEWIEMYEPALNYMAGVSFEYPLSEKLSLTGSLNFERRTSRQEYKYYISTDPMETPQEHEAKIRYTLEYLTLPLNVKYYFDPKKKFYLTGGPYAGYFLNDILKNHGEEAESMADYKKLDFGVDLGLGTVIPVKANHLSLEIRYNWGLAGINDYESQGGSVKTSSLNLIVGWQFEL